MGDPAGIGPEICVRAVAEREVLNVCSPIIIGNTKILDQTSRQLGIDVNIPLMDGGEELGQFTIGIDAAETGKASAVYIETAVDMWRRGDVDAIATAPISKRALSLAGYKFPG